MHKKVILEIQKCPKYFVRVKEIAKVFTNSEKINLNDTKLSVNSQKILEIYKIMWHNTLRG